MKDCNLKTICQNSRFRRGKYCTKIKQNKIKQDVGCSTDEKKKRREENVYVISNHLFFHIGKRNFTKEYK